MRWTSLAERIACMRQRQSRQERVCCGKSGSHWHGDRSRDTLPTGSEFHAERPIMKEAVAVGSDGVSLNYAISEYQQGKPWLALIIPFGLRVTIAKPFFDFFQPQYNIVSWESRLILSPDEQPAPPGAF